MFYMFCFSDQFHMSENTKNKNWNQDMQLTTSDQIEVRFNYLRVLRVTKKH